MTKKRKKSEELTPEELEEQNGEALPDREAMSIVQPPHIATIGPEPDLITPPSPPDENLG